MTADATKEREFWLRLILWVQAEAKGENNDPVSGQKSTGLPSTIAQFQAQRWLTHPLTAPDMLLVCEYAGIEYEDALKLRRQMRSLYGVVGGQGYFIAKRQDAGGK